MSPSEVIDIHGLTCGQLRGLARERIPRGHGVAKKIYEQVFEHGRFEPEAFGLNAEGAALWRTHFRFELPEVARVVSEDTTTGVTAKAVLRLPTGEEYECVLLPMGRGRHTICVSSQVGCKMGCGFCETGLMGLVRNLTPAEVVAQLLVARHQLGWDFRNVVFMGMGEALDNFDTLAQVLRMLIDPESMRLGQERITVCTVGNVRGIEKLAALGYRRLNLSVSLNAANDTLRSRIMPVNRAHNLGELQQALLGYRQRANFVFGVNYCLMPGLNDAREHATQVAEFCRPLGRALVNVIPYNPGSHPIARAPEPEEIDRFIGWLREEGMPVRLRITKGRSVMAACGQLGNLEQGKKRLPLAHA